MPGLTASDWTAATGGDSAFAAYMRRGREAFERHQGATLEETRGVYERAAKQVAFMVRNLPEDNPTRVHMTEIEANLTRMAANLSEEVLTALYSGIRLAVKDGVDGVTNAHVHRLANVFDGDKVRAMFAPINDRALFSTLARTRPDGLHLSNRVWDTSLDWRDATLLTIEEGIAAGLSAANIAKRVERYLTPNANKPLKRETARRLRVPQDTSMPAMRLAVTEMNNAFHEATIMANHESPSYRGVYWRLSNTHPVRDLCDAYAERGGNGFFEKGTEPIKPHPWCRCVILPGHMPIGMFTEQLQDWLKDPGSEPSLEAWYQAHRDVLGLPKALPPEPAPTPTPEPVVKPPQPYQRPTHIPKPDPYYNVDLSSTPYPGFVDREDAESWLGAKYPGTRFDFVGAVMDTINPTMSQLDKLLQEWTDVQKHLKYVGTYGGENIPFKSEFKGAWAHASLSGQYIGLNPNVYSNYAKYTEQLTRSTASKWHPDGCDTIESVMTHEFGHILEGVITRTPGFWSKTYLYSGFGKINDTFSMFVTSLANKRVGGKVSGYVVAKKDPFHRRVEAWAESFASLYHGDPKTWGTYQKRQRVFLDEVMKAPRIETIKDVQTMQDIPNENGERTRRIAEMRELAKRMGIDA